MSTHNLFLNTDMKSIDFLFSIYLNKRVFVMRGIIEGYLFALISNNGMLNVLFRIALMRRFY